MSFADLQALTQRRLDAFVEIGLGAELWDVQTAICRAASVPRSVTGIPSCNASGKTFILARLALAFFWAFEDALVVTTSSTEDQLKDALWSEIRGAYAAARVPIPGRLPPADMWLRDGNKHFIKGTVARTREGFQGLHSAHKLIIADEASSIDEEAASGINALLSTGDARLVLALNPTDDASWAAEVINSPGTNVIRIRAWDTPNLAHLTNDEILQRWNVQLEPERVARHIAVPPGANLTTPEWLDDMFASGSGPGTPEWENRVEAQFWSSSDTQLISPSYLALAHKVERMPGRKVLGIDLAPYGDAENAICYRVGNTVQRLEVQPAVRPDIFWQHVRSRVLSFKPDILIWDADGVGAGSYTDAQLATHNTKTTLFPFRGGTKVGGNHTNTRSLWWWRLRQQFQNENIRLDFTDRKLEEQLTNIRYGFTETGLIKVESKQQMKKRNIPSPDRADAVMYAFAIEPPVPKRPKPHPASERAMWDRDLARLDRRQKESDTRENYNYVLDTADW